MARVEYEETVNHMGNFTPQTLQNPGKHHNTPSLEEEAQSKSPQGPAQEGSTILISPRQKTPLIINQIDLNSAPVSSNNAIPLLSQNHCDSQNSQQIGSSKENSNTDEEVSQTVEIGEKIGFQVQGYEDQIREIIKKRRATIIDQ